MLETTNLNKFVFREAEIILLIITEPDLRVDQTPKDFENRVLGTAIRPGVVSSLKFKGRMQSSLLPQIKLKGRGSRAHACTLLSRSRTVICLQTQTSKGGETWKWRAWPSISGAHSTSVNRPRTDIHKGNLTLNTSKEKITGQWSGTASIGPIILTLPKSDGYKPISTEPQFRKANQSTRKKHLCSKQ